MFTKCNTLGELLSDSQRSALLRILYGDYLLAYFPVEYWNEPLAFIQYRAATEWSTDLTGITDQLIAAANLIEEIMNGQRSCMNPWTGKSYDPLVQITDPSSVENVMLIGPKVQPGRKKPAVLICPGGGYTDVCFAGEGNPVQIYLEHKGYRAFTLKYRTAPCRYPNPQNDLIQTVNYIREHSNQYGTDADHLFLIGFSAAGHLCLTATAMMPENQRPNALILGYPVVSFVRDAHEESFQCLTGGDERLRNTLSAENVIDDAFPPVFAWTCLDDACVPPSNTKRLEKSLKAHHIPCEIHYYPSGGHGCALAFDKPEAYQWSFQMLRFLQSYGKN